MKPLHIITLAALLVLACGQVATADAPQPTCTQLYTVQPGTWTAVTLTYGAGEWRMCALAPDGSIRCWNHDTCK